MILIQFARFGNRASAHDVLAHSGLDRELLRQLVWRSDSPPDSSGLELEPFVSAYRLDALYVVQATRTDLKASRPGMVVTNTAVLPLDAVGDLDISTLWEALSTDEFSCEEPRNTIEFIESAESESTHAHSPGAGSIASALLSAGTALWTGGGLPQCLACVWRHLGVQDRARFVVGAAAHPEGISVPREPDSLTVLLTAESVLSRWQGWSATTAGSAPGEDPVRDAMFGDDEGRSAGLAERLGVSEIKGNAWRYLATASTWFTDLADLDHEQCRSLLQLLGLLQPDPARGVEVKEQVLTRLLVLSTPAPFADIRGLRAVPWETTARGQGMFLQPWSAAVVGDAARTSALIDAVSAVRSSYPDPFYDQLSSSLARQVDSAALERVALAAVDDESGGQVIDWLADGDWPDSDVDAALANAATRTEHLPMWLTASSRANRLPRTHAASIDVTDAVAAWRQQLGLKPRSDEADNLLQSRTGDAGVVAAARVIADRELTSRAARAVISSPDLLRDGTLTDERFRAIWFEAVRLGADPWDVLAPSKAVGPLLDMVVSGEPFEPLVLVSLSATTAADISTYVSRASVWMLLPPDALGGFRSATAESLARSYRPSDPKPEQVLQAAMLSQPLLAAISRESPAQAVALLRFLPAAQSRDAIVVVTHGRFNSSEEEALASLIVDRRWWAAADAIISFSAARSDLARAAQRVSSLYDPLDRILRFFTGSTTIIPTVSASDLRMAVVEVAAGLYKDGPKADSIWERAGGDEADVLSGRTGRLAWGQAIDAASTGRRGAPSICDLIETMLADYPNNDHLRAIKSALADGISR